LYAEHFIYSAAVAVIVGMILVKYGFKDQAWIIVLLAMLPDVDHFNNVFWDYGLMSWGVKVIPILYLGIFHNITALVILSVIVGFILFKIMDIDFDDAFLLVSIAYAAHLVEDLIVYPPAYKYLYPFIDKPYGLNILHETGNLIMGDTKIMWIGMILLVGAVIIRIRYEPDWVIGIEIKKKIPTILKS
jgi:membrane-bound metal-dependent hydrolase YbcI (DUF457 family)